MSVDMVNTLGGSATPMSYGELYTALDRGVVDAVEWVSPSLDFKMVFHKIAPFYYTGWHEPASDMHFFVNQKAFAKLSKKHKSILTTAIKAVSSDMYSDNFYQNVLA